MAKTKSTPPKAQPSKAQKVKAKTSSSPKTTKSQASTASAASAPKNAAVKRPVTPARAAAASRKAPAIKASTTPPVTKTVAAVNAKAQARPSSRSVTEPAKVTPAKKANVSASKPTGASSTPRIAEKVSVKVLAAVAKAKQPASNLKTRVVTEAVAKSPVQKAEDPVAAMSNASAGTTADKKAVSQRHGFKCNEFIVYPAHGVGRIVGIEEQEIAGMSLELFVITFEKDKMTLRVPTSKLDSVGMRKLADDSIVKKATETLKGRARVKRTMWSRRAQEYEAKINSGDLVSIAEVVRDLYRSEAQPEQSYSERQLYEAALDRMARELAVVEKLDERGAVQFITDVLSKSAKGRRNALDTAEASEEGTEPHSVEAA